VDLFEYQARDIFEKHGVPVLAAALLQLLMRQKKQLQLLVEKLSLRHKSKLADAEKLAA
jgi:succinyl-CoA synthetase beta subunit